MDQHSIAILICDRRERVREGSLTFGTEGGPFTMQTGAAKGEKWWPASKADAIRLREAMAAAEKLWTPPPKGKKRTEKHKVEAWHTRAGDK